MSDDTGAYALEPGRVRRSFDRAAQTYDAAAVLHAEVRENLLQRLQLVTLVPVWCWMPAPARVTPAAH